MRGEDSKGFSFFVVGKGTGTSPHTWGRRSSLIKEPSQQEHPHIRGEDTKMLSKSST